MLLRSDACIGRTVKVCRTLSGENRNTEEVKVWMLSGGRLA